MFIEDRPVGNSEAVSDTFWICFLDLAHVAHSLVFSQRCKVDWKLLLEKDIWVFFSGPGCSNRGWARLSGDRSVSSKGLEHAMNETCSFVQTCYIKHASCKSMTVIVNFLSMTYLFCFELAEFFVICCRKGAWTCLRMLKRARKEVHERLNHVMVSP